MPAEYGYHDLRRYPSAGGDGRRENRHGRAWEMGSRPVGVAIESKTTNVTADPYDLQPPTIQSDAPYDPYIAPGGSAPKPGNDKTAKLQAGIDETVEIMRDNITKVAERGAALDHLQNQSENLTHQAGNFRRGANRVRKNMWWKDMKMRIIIAVGIAIILVIIIVPIVKSTHK